jgi:hypothetical protein
LANRGDSEHSRKSALFMPYFASLIITATAKHPAVGKSLHAKIGELTLENDFLEGALTKAGLLSAKR